MVSVEHEAWLEPIRHRPALAAELLAGALRQGVPRYADASLSSARTNQIVPVESEADTVVLLRNRAGKKVLAIVVEVQRSKSSPKRWTWPFYLASLRRRHTCGVVLLVLAPDRGVARWCAEPIRLGHPGFVLTPLVIGPDLIPAITDPEEAARSPELAVLAAMAHGNDTVDGQGVRVVEAAFAAFDRIDKETARLYAQCVLDGLSKSVRAELEVRMSRQEGPTLTWSQELHAKGRAEGVAQGRADGMALALFEVLEARGVQISEAVHERIAQCTDSAQLDAWIRRAATAGPGDSAEALFGQ